MVIPGKYIKVISGMYENDIAVVKVGSGVCSWFCIELNMVVYPHLEESF